MVTVSRKCWVWLEKDDALNASGAFLASYIFIGR